MKIQSLNFKMQNDKSKCKIIKDFEENILLKNYTTFKIGGPAKYFFAAKTKEDLIEAVLWAKRKKLPFFILGGGSNVLFSDKGYKGLVINFQSPLVESGIQKNKIIAGAGTSLGELVKASFRKGLAGLEWAAGIPGTVGGAVCGNSGAFWKSMKDIVEEVEVFDAENGKIKIFKNEDCRFSYKNSVFEQKGDLVILSVRLKLEKGDKKEIQKEINEHLSYRKRNQPLNFPSAGSIFKNPLPSGISEKFSAGELIEKCGLKRKRIGDAEISEKHANFIVNLGGAKAKDVVALMKLAKQEVKNKFGIALEEEIRIIHT